MITFKTLGQHGRFGNQMFQYATLFAIAKKRGYDFGVPYNNRNFNEYFDFCLPDCFPNLTGKNSDDAILEYSAQQTGFEYNPGIFGIMDNTDIMGYFQSEKYFADYREDILKEFTFSNEITDKATDIRSLTREPTISLHIRLGDYISLQETHPVCKFEYYQQALTLVPDDMLIYVFSDDLKMAENIFAPLNRKMVFTDTGNKYVDMCLMSLCDYHIIANSSFSWWGSWLSNSKKTIAPARWFGSSPEAPKNWSDVYSKDWIVI